MWAFSFEYPNGVVTDTLFVPVQLPMKLTLRSIDVNHSMYIPAFRIKKDVIPNRENIMWFSTPEAKSFDIACAEYCGLRHAYMYTRLVALEPGAFEEWYRGVSLGHCQTLRTPGAGSDIRQEIGSKYPWTS